MKKKRSSNKVPANTVAGYLAKVPKEQRIALERLRKLIRSAAPQGEECITYQMPGFRLNGKFLVSFAAWRNHCAFYPASFPIQTHKDQLRSYDIHNGTIRFLPENPLSASLVRKLVKTRMSQIAR